MSVIELGEVTSGSEQPQQADVPNGYDRRLFRRAGVALVAVACVLNLAASAPPGPSRALRTLWSVAFDLPDRFAVTPDTVYTGVEDAGGELVAYDLATGARRWAVMMPDPTAWPTFVPEAGVLLVPYGRVGKEVDAPDGGSYLNEFYRDTIALDARTGDELWRRPGEIYLTTTDSVLLADRDPHDTEMRALRLVRIRDGGTVWSRPLLHVERVTTGGADPARPDLLVMVTPAGGVEILRLANGARISTGRVAWRPILPQDGVFTDVFLDDRRLYVRVAGPTGYAMTAYTVDTFREVWRVDGTAAVVPYPCGDLICGIEQEGFAAYDPATGAVRWRNDRIRNAWPAGSGRLVADNGDRWTLIDEATGRLLTDLGSGAPVPDLDGRVTYLIRPTVSPRGRSTVNRIDPRAGTVELRGALDWVNESGCLATGDHLVCSTVAGQLIVTLVG